MPKKTIWLFFVGFLLVFSLIQLLIIPWQTGYKIEFDGQRIPIHLGNHPVWAPPHQIRILEKTYKTKPIVDREELANRFGWLFPSAIILIFLRQENPPKV